MLLKRTHPESSDHGLGMGLMVRVAGRFPVVPARGQNPTVLLPDWIRTVQPRPVKLQQDGDEAVGNTDPFRIYPVAAKE